MMEIRHQGYCRRGHGKLRRVLRNILPFIHFFVGFVLVC
jgi:hypothetical protein